MTEHYSTVLVAWMFIVLIGAWVLVNALIDVGARRVRRWVADHWEAQSNQLGRLAGRYRAPR